MLTFPYNVTIHGFHPQYASDSHVSEVSLMSHFIFIHDFYRDGYNDVLAEVRVLQACGLWTKEKRKNTTKQEVSCYHATKHKFPCMDVSYWAGRVAAIKSATTAQYPTHGWVLFTPPGLTRSTPAFCGSCGDRALWKSWPSALGLPIRFRCDRCKQEQVRLQTCYRTPDGWDWDEHEDELFPLAVPVGNKLVVKTGIQPESIFFPCVSVIGLGMLDFSLHLPAPLLILQTLFVLHIMVRGKDYWQGFRRFFKSEL